MSGEQWTLIMLVRMSNWILFSAGWLVDKWFHRLETCRKANNWKQPLKLWSSQQICLACCNVVYVCRAFISKCVLQTVMLVRQICRHYWSPNCDHVMQHRHSDAHIQNTHRYWHEDKHNICYCWSAYLYATRKKHLALWIRQNVSKSNTSPN